MHKHFKNTKLFAFDLDGTLYLGDSAIPGAVELIKELRANYRVVYFTNNSTKRAGQIYDKLRRLGFAGELSEVYTSSSATADYLKENGLNDLYAVGTPEFRGELEERGLRLIDNDSAENLVVGLDPEFNYQKIAAALSILRRGGKFIACNLDPSFPAGADRSLPGCGALVAAISAAANRRPDFIVGKPNTYILSKISATFGPGNREIVVVGDSYESDIMMALNYCSPAVLIGGPVVKKRSVLQVRDLAELSGYLRGKNEYFGI